MHHQTSPTTNDEYNLGDTVWAKYGRMWYPAEICCLADIPEHLQQWFPRVENKLIVKWFGEENYSAVAYNQVDVLGENLVDAARAAKSKHMQ